ncbi:hypothetical protein PUNSTDRAFT_121947 [Punctularia strigosozonata HHB-11173 SS5]|uniref:uncharacterized protein n=1 Tax=Punctularia strigosozonata (strain HHB-11173) TaxID=741275 RepID=UPI000441849B|nr:uncharacterized protein PUNSTDRAFT_121947 [Punctularia strigosozonata HHB-11173 SS5]EIN05990.1 hypothetical protein PUNSTDRAFT_121947 [Punctularia strigosozonata HHB-11173 SS5]
MSNYELLTLVHADGDNMMFGSDGSALAKETSDRLDSAVATAFFVDSREASQNSEPDHSVSLGSWLLDRKSPFMARFSTEQERRYAAQFALGLNGWTGADLQNVSFRYWGFEREYEGGDAVVADGYDKLLEPLQQNVLASGGEIKLGEQVREVAFDEDQQLVKVETVINADNSTTRTYLAKSCICTIPLGVLKSAEGCPSFTPKLPPRRMAAINRLGFGLLNKIVLQYPRVWWPQEPGFFTILQGGESRQSLSGTTSNVHASPRDYLDTIPVWAQSYAHVNGNPILVLYLGGSSGHAIEQLPDDEVQTWAHDLLASRLFQLALAGGKPPTPLQAHVTRWSSDPHARGSYTYIPAATASEDLDYAPSPLDIVELSRPLWGGRLRFAGEHTELDCYASVHGAAISGWREGKRVNNALAGVWAEMSD